MVHFYIDIHRALVYFTGPELTCRKASYSNSPRQDYGRK